MTKEELKEKYSKFIADISEILGLGKPIDILKLCQITDRFFRPLQDKVTDLEKENERLKARCEQARDEGTGYMQQLEKENEVLKEHIKTESCIDCVDYIKNRKLEKQLEQAKELLRRSYDNYISMQPLRGEIENFLKEEE